jgi:tetratricopeptide (TPR) repeat protein
MRNLLALLTAVGNRVADWVGLESDFPGRSWWPFIPIVSIVIGLAAVAWIMALGNRRKTPTEKLAHAELLSRRGKHQEAKDEFREVHAYGRAAQMAVKLNRFEEAVELALKGNDFQTAAGILSGQGRFAEAAQAFEQARKPMEAADHWEKAGDFDRALRQYASAGNGRKVQEILSRLERWGELSRILSEELISARAHLGPNPTVKAQERISHQAERTAEVFKRAGDFTGAYEVFLRSGQVLKAAECLEKLGQPERAADL